MAAQHHLLRDLVRPSSGLKELAQTKKKNSFDNTQNTPGYSVAQGFPNWGTCTPGGTFAYLKRYI